MYMLLKRTLMKAIVLMFITILPIAVYIYIEDDIQFTWNINETDNIDKYIITVEINPENKEIYINEAVEFVNNTKKELDKVYFYMFPQSLSPNDVCLDLKSELGEQIVEGKGKLALNIESIERNGELLNYNIIGNKQDIIMVKLDKKIEEGQKVDIEIKGVLGFPHGTGKTEDGRTVYDINNWYPVIAQYDEGWILNVDESSIEKIYSDEGCYYVEVIVPEGADVSASGDLIDKHSKGDKKYFRYQNNTVTQITFVLN